MSDVIEIGPLALAKVRLIATVAIWLFLAATFWIGARTKSRAAAAGWGAVLIGILVARVAYVFQNLEAFALNPIETLYIWQGGFSVIAGILGAASTLIFMIRGRALALAMATLAVLTTASLALLAVSAPPERRAAPQLHGLVDAAGVSVTPDIRGPYVINLWATWCPPCRREMPMLVQTAAANPDVPILLLNQGETPARVRRYLTSEGISGQDVLIDPRSEVSRNLGSGALPTTIFIGSDGTITSVHTGEISRAALYDGIRQLRR